MDKIRTYEKEFCETFITPRLAERLAYELGSENKRNNALRRFCHNAGEILKSDFVLCSGEFSGEEIIARLKKITDCGEWLFIGWDGSEISDTRYAVDTGIRSGMGFAAVSADLGAAVVREEQCFGTPMAYIMKTHER